MTSVPLVSWYQSMKINLLGAMGEVSPLAPHRYPREFYCSECCKKGSHEMPHAV